MVTLDGSQTVDPEGDNLEIEFYSSRDGVLQWSDEPSGNVWQGHLSRGVHTIEMRVTDDAPEHVETYKVSSVLISLDCTEDVLSEAISNKCNLIITHHPLIFSSLK